MKRDHNIENFLITRPLWAKFVKDRYGIPKMWIPQLTLGQASYSGILSGKNISTNRNKSNFIIENFAYDSDLERIWRNPFSHLKDLRECLAVLTPDNSVTDTMTEAQVINSVFKNRWMGCYWQQNYINAIPTISWAGPWSYDICILGVPHNSIYAISTIGVKDKAMFIDGYNYMKDNINPPFIICYGRPIDGMTGSIIDFDYDEAFMPPKHFEQTKLFETSRLITLKEEL